MTYEGIRVRTNLAGIIHLTDRPVKLTEEEPYPTRCRRLLALVPMAFRSDDDRPCKQCKP